MARPLVIFDLDGTLVDSAPCIAAALNATGLGRHLLSVDDVRPLVSLGAEQLVREALLVPEPEISTAVNAFRTHYAKEPCRADDAYPGVHEVMRELRTRSIALAICTNKPQRLAELAMDCAGLLADAVVGSVPHLPPKPDPALIRHVLALLGHPTKILFVGDSIVDATAANAAGVPFVFAAFGYGPVAPAERCMSVISRFDELRDVIRTSWQLEREDRPL